MLVKLLLPTLLEDPTLELLKVLLAAKLTAPIPAKDDCQSDVFCCEPVYATLPLNRISPPALKKCRRASVVGNVTLKI